ncbi:unnamed protein product [Rhizophagus irregularis]|nr:unnamed protein product [Rhizophagus irregularis]
MISSNLKKEYITKEYEFDIDNNDIQSSFSQNVNSAIHNSFNSQHQIASRSINKLISTVTVSSSRKRNIEELELETQKSKKNRKHTNTDNSDIIKLGQNNVI